mgnify:CR=1 FL=1
MVLIFAGFGLLLARTVLLFVRAGRHESTAGNAVQRLVHVHDLANTKRNVGPFEVVLEQLFEPVWAGRSARHDDGYIEAFLDVLLIDFRDDVLDDVLEQVLVVD